MFRCLHCMFVCIALHSLQWPGCLLLAAASLQLLQGCCLSRQCLPCSEVSDWGNSGVWAAASCWQRDPWLHRRSLPCWPGRAPGVRRRLQQQHCLSVCPVSCLHTADLLHAGKASRAVSLCAHAESSQASCLSNNSVIFILKTLHMDLNSGALSISFKEHGLRHFLQ